MGVTGHRVDGLKIAKAREALGRGKKVRMTQAKFAERVGIHLVTMNRIENGKANVSLDLLEKIAAETGHPREHFLADGDDDEAEAAPMALTRDEYALYGELTARIVALKSLTAVEHKEEIA